MSENVFESFDPSKITSKNTTAKIEHFQTLRTIYDFNDVVKNYITDKLKEKFSTLETTEPDKSEPTPLVKCVVDYLKGHCFRIDGNGAIDRMESNDIYKLIALLQSVRLYKVIDISLTGYGVGLYFEDNLGEEDTGVNDFIFMMRAILVELRKNNFIKFFTIYRNRIQIVSDQLRGTIDSDRTSISTPDNIRSEVERIVYIIFGVSKVSKVSEVSEVPIQSITTSFSHANISDAILEFFKKVEASDIKLTPGTNTITLTLHDKIKLFEKVKDPPKYCNELTQFINLMGVLCSICTTELYAIGRHNSVTFNIPEGSMNSLSKSVKSCPKAADAAAAAAAEAEAKADAAAKAAKAATGGDGRRPRRKHARKTRHKRAHKTRHKRKHRSRTARKHKKYSRKR